MSSLLGEVGGFLDKYLIGYALGTASGPALAPFVQDLANEAWTLNAVVPPDVITLAQGVAQGQVTKAAAYKWAKETGFGADQMDALVSIANVGPPLGQAMELLRRGVWTKAQYTTALNRQGIEATWYPGLLALQADILSPFDLARAIHKSLIPDPGLLAVPQPTGEGNIRAYPVYQIDALKEALGSGYDKDRLGVLVGLQGNPMGAHEAAQALFRGVLQPVDYDRAIAEGNTRNEWGDAIKEQSRQIPTTHEYVENAIRGWSDKPAMVAGAARHGMTADDVELIWENAGRPLSWHQVWIGLQRGGTYDGPTGDIAPAFLDSLRQSNIRPEYYNLAWAQRYNYPSAFVLRALTSSGELTEAQTEEVLLFEGYEPGFAKLVATQWAGSGGTTTSALAKSHTTSAVTAIRKAYIVAQMSEAEARADLQALAVTQADQDSLVAIWNVQRRATLPTLTVTQIQKGNLTRAEQEGALQRQGYDPQEIIELIGPPTA